MKIFLSIILMLLVFSGFAQADFYKWEDEAGNLHITDYPPPSDAKKMKVHKASPHPGIDAPTSPQTADKQTVVSPPSSVVDSRTSHEVILYTTSWCPYCKKAKAFFESRGIPYTEYDIEKDKDAAERKKQLSGGGGVPFAIVNGEHISGYSPSAYEEALRKND